MEQQRSYSRSTGTVQTLYLGEGAVPARRSSKPLAVHRPQTKHDYEGAEQVPNRRGARIVVWKNEETDPVGGRSLQLDKVWVVI